MESKTGLLAFFRSHHAVQSKTGPLIILNIAGSSAVVSNPLFNNKMLF